MDYINTINLLKAENYDIIVTVQQYQNRLQENNQRIAQLSQAQAENDAKAAAVATEDVAVTDSAEPETNPEA